MARLGVSTYWPMAPAADTSPAGGLETRQLRVSLVPGGSPLLVTAGRQSYTFIPVGEKTAKLERETQEKALKEVCGRDPTLWIDSNLKPASLNGRLHNEPVLMWDIYRQNTAGNAPENQSGEREESDVDGTMGPAG